MEHQILNHPSSYRDPSGYLFYKDHILYRQVNKSYKDHYDQLINSGLYEKLLQNEYIIPHKSSGQNVTGSPDWYVTIIPEYIPFISYPYEWSFDMLKDAALLTLEIAREALNYNMILKDASAFNIQFYKGKPVLIDTLSFIGNDGSKPWVAYRQFCEHFLAPLALMHYLKVPVQSLELGNADGIPLNFAKRLLPIKSKLNLHTYLHIHLHTRLSEKEHGEKANGKTFSKQKLKRLLKSLEEAVISYNFNLPSGVWSNYYKEANERENYITTKKTIISSWLNDLQVRSAIDIGSNEGVYSMLLSEKNIYTISLDQDHYSINNLYKKIKEEEIKNIHPLIVNMIYPTPSIGVLNKERSSFIERAHADLVLALALIHHLAIAYNIHFTILVKMFRMLGKTLIIEFVPEDDKKIQYMLAQKGIENDWYTLENFLKAFSLEYEIKASEKIGHTGRTIFLMNAYEK